MNPKPHLLHIPPVSPSLPSSISTRKAIPDPVTEACRGHYSCGQDHQAISQAVSTAYELLDLQARKDTRLSESQRLAPWLQRATESRQCVAGAKFPQSPQEPLNEAMKIKPMDAVENPGCSRCQLACQLSHRQFLTDSVLLHSEANTASETWHDIM